MSGSYVDVPPIKSRRGEPPYEIAVLFPDQGTWSEGDFFELDLKSNRLLELSDGCLEVLPMPTLSHQLILKYLLLVFNTFVESRRLGRVLFAPLPVRLWQDKIREPDLMFLSSERLTRKERYPEGVDLALEVVSDDDESRERDLVKKRAEYAQAGIPEYWIVDPRNGGSPFWCWRGQPIAFTESSHRARRRVPCGCRA